MICYYTEAFEHKIFYCLEHRKQRYYLIYLLRGEEVRFELVEDQEQSLPGMI